MREDIEGAFGQVDILVNCAGGDIGASGNKPEPNNILGITYDDLITLTNNNLIGTMLVTQAFVPQMVERQSGIVVNIGSAAAHVGLSRRRHLRHPQGGRRRLHALPRRRGPRRRRARQRGEPGTEQDRALPGDARGRSGRRWIPSGSRFDRYAEPDEIADAVAFLCSARAQVHARPGAPRRRRADALSGLTGRALWEKTNDRRDCPDRWLPVRGRAL